MMKWVVAGVVAIGMASPAHAVNIVKDSGFEMSLDTSPWTFTTDFYLAAEPNHSGNMSAFTGCSADDGSDCISPVNGSYARQTLTTVAGQTYSLSLFVYNGVGGEGTEFAVYWDGRNILDVINPSPAEQFVQYTATNLVATTDSTVFQVNGRNDGSYIYFDDVVVDSSGGPMTAVPEPASVALLGVGMAGLLMRRRGKPLLA